MPTSLAALVLLAAVQEKYRVEEGAGALARAIHVDRSALAMEVSPDGKTLAIGSGSDVLLAALPDGKLLRSFKTGPGYVRGLAFSPDGKTVAAGLIGGLALYDAASGAPLWKGAGHPSPMKGGEGAYGVVFSPDGAWLLSISRDDPNLRAWSVKDGAAGKVVDSKLQTPLRIATAGGRVAVLAEDGLAAFDAELAPLWKQKLRMPGGLAFAPDGASIAVGITGLEGSIQRLDAASGEKKGQISFVGKGTPSGVAWTPDGRRLVTAAGRGGVLLWEAAKADAGPTAKLDEAFRAGDDLDRAAVVALGGKLAVVAGGRKEIRLYTLPD